MTRIRKQFEFNGMHIVRNCSSERCKFSLHGHTYQVELIFGSTTGELDNGEMLLDFGLMKNSIKDFVKMFDNSYSLWEEEDEDFKAHIYKIFPRVVELGHSPSAEIYSRIFLIWVNAIIDATDFNNGEGDIYLEAARVHETRTGWAETTSHWLVDGDAKVDDILDSYSVVPSQSIVDSLTNKDILLLDEVARTGDKLFTNPVVAQQIITEEK